LAGGGHAPYGIPNVVSDQQRTRFIDGNPDGSSAGLVIGAQETGHDILSHSAWAAILERHKDNLIAVERAPVPTAMLANECAARIVGRQRVPRVEGKPQRSDMGAQRIIRWNGLRNQIRLLRMDDRICVDAVERPNASRVQPDRGALSVLGKQEQKRRCRWPSYDHQDRSDVGKPFPPLGEPSDLRGAFIVAQCQQCREFTDDQINPEDNPAHGYPLKSR